MQPQETLLKAKDRYQHRKDILPPSVKSLLVDIDNAAIRMNAMLHTDVFVNVETLLSSIRNHYIGQARADLYRLIGAVDVLGNPGRFVRGLGTGMVDFYEPAQGLVKSPGAFGLGVARVLTPWLVGSLVVLFTLLVNLLAVLVLVSHSYLLMVITNINEKFQSMSKSCKCCRRCNLWN